MLRKVLLLIIPVVVLLSTISTVAGLERQRQPDWQAALANYVRATETEAIAVHVLSTDAAGQPGKLQPGMGITYVGADQWQWGIETLPFPPDALYCVVVERAPTKLAPATMRPIQQVLYVAHHSDHLWRMGWLVHQGPTLPLTAKARTDLSALGCKIDAMTDAK